ncbi:hypothetical protein [Clostridium celatum]|uniref:Uncharacterized protein n=1 Tax=Clostridium celatum DSM 1785 TaxID=545697 RepID=L1Q5K8_9CLOT|nr:hypothetical protein [Clostridium celatum]EKY23279.1 hypothetical protein HMPREF0216_02949 [Clostridium celatum DSM 1785]MCE9655492.1 hypothetical protein [Clostridium celatum]MDU3723993.1 hypothetical protein [Clostridium celatum]MDU6295744.1 hypothetical protein [Clostridium celatum]MDY3361528.1 hypothetical protein [Clostridium celatum]
MYNKKEILKFTCPICGEEMKEYEYGYDNKVHGKIYFKCDCCGHKESKII